MNLRTGFKLLTVLASVTLSAAITTIGDAPPFASINVPPNLMLALSVEWPTGDLPGYKGIADNVPAYACGGFDSNGNAVCYFDSTTAGSAREYIGYFDPRKCYDYDGSATSTINQLITSQAPYPAASGYSPGYFYPVALVDGMTTTATAGSGTNYSDPLSVLTTGHTCATRTNGGHQTWSGNYLNWVTMHAIDEFRSALTGGDRVVDTVTNGGTQAVTILEKAVHDGQGGFGNFPVHLIQNSAITTGSVSIPALNPSSYSWYSGSSKLYARVLTSGGMLNPPYTATNSSGTALTLNGSETAATALSDGSPLDATTVTDTSTKGISLGRSVQFATDSGFTKSVRTYMVRVKVCDNSVSQTLIPMEPNCQLYNSSYKPTGLIQQNVNNIRVGATGYIMNNAQAQSGGVLRARLHDTGQTAIVPNGTGGANQYPEISPDGVFIQHVFYNQHDTDGTAHPFNDEDSAGNIPLSCPPPYTSTSHCASDANSNPIAQIKISGVINYLNKFGKIPTGITGGPSYKGYDTVSEMYYEALRYIHLSTADDSTNTPGIRQSTPEYTSGATSTAAYYDGFPMITNWQYDDPLKWYCQKNVIIGIADSNTWCDSQVPGYVSGSTNGSQCLHPYLNNQRDTLLYTSGGGGINNLLTAFKAMDATEALAAPPTNVGSASTNTYETYSEGRSNTMAAAALAYWANVNDIRPNFPGKPSASKVTAQTYWLDVQEAGVATNGPTYHDWDWMAAKYGGFTDNGHKVTGAGLPTAGYPSPDNNSTWLNSVTGDPNNYFRVNRPDYMRAGLQTIFSSVLGGVQTAAGATLGSAQITSTTSTAAYVSEYNPNGWYSQAMLGEQLVANAITGAPSTTTVWDAAANMDTQAAASTSSQYANDTDTARRIVTMGSSHAGVAFRWSNLTPTQQAAIIAGAQTQSANGNAVVHYLRGDRTNEPGGTGNLNFRQRTHLLGDIVDSEARLVAAPSGSYTSLPGYASFINAHSNRTPAIYVGANDGMLHAINGDVTTGTTTGGLENWAYVPSFVINKPNVGTPTNVGIGFLANANYAHRYSVDQTPTIIDVDFCNTKAGVTTPIPASCTSGGTNWHTILVAGLNKGGTGYYALDVTNPGTTSDSESTVAQRVLWEFTDADMGYSFGYPVIARTAQWGWVVLLSSGYNNVSGTNPGKGFLYVLDPSTGTLIQKIATGVGTATTPSGLSKGRGFIQNALNYQMDYAYYGDLLGNVWRFDLTGTGPASTFTYPAPTQIAQLTDASGTPQPITGQLVVDVDTDGIERWVFAGTGQLLSSSDEGSTQQQTFYALRDGTLGTVYTGGSTLPCSSSLSGGTYPVVRAGLTQIFDAQLISGGGAVGEGKCGWFYDFTGNSGGSPAATERMVEDVTSNSGLVAFATVTPANPSVNVCSPNGVGSAYTVNFSTGQSVITDPSTGFVVKNFTSPTAILKPEFVAVNGQAVREFYTSSTGTINSISGKFGGWGQPTRVFWKEIFQ